MVVSESELSLLLRILKFKVIVVSREMRGGKPRFFFWQNYAIYNILLGKQPQKKQISS